MKPTQARPAVRLGLILVALVAALAVTPSATQATPAYARQTGVSCQACHTLTRVARKLRGDLLVAGGAVEGAHEGVPDRSSDETDPDFPLVGKEQQE